MFHFLSHGGYSEISAEENGVWWKRTFVCGQSDSEKRTGPLFPALAQTREDICLTIVGEGQEKEALMDRQKSLGSHPASAFWDMLRENRCGSFTIMQMYLSCRPEKIALDW